MGVNAVRRRQFLQVVSAGALGVFGRHARASPESTRTKPTVIVVGGGFAGSQCALTLRRSDPSIAVVLIDPDARYVTCPMSNSVIVGLRSLESITVPRSGLEHAGVRVIRDRVDGVDVRRRRLRLAGGAVLVYDKLVLAAGIRFLWGRPQGYDEAATRLMPHAWQAGVQTEMLAAQLRRMRDGGVVAISVPAGPMRCPPGPFERASLIANYLKQHKPRSKVLIFDANNQFPRQDSFNEAWRNLYPGMIDWIPVVNDGAVVRVEPAKMTLYTSEHTHRVDVANIIPPQAPAWLAVEAGLASQHGWCPVVPDTFESTLIREVHVIGDACIADPMPKSASAANCEAKQCALAIVAAFRGDPPPEPRFDSVCYSLLAPGRALSIHGRFRRADGAIEKLPDSQAAISRTGDLDAYAAEEAQNAENWYAGIVADSFGTGSGARA